MDTAPPEHRPLFTEKRLQVAVIILAIGFFTAALRFLIWVNADHSAVFYLAIPVIVSLALIAFTHAKEPALGWPAKHWNAFRSSMIVFLASAVILHEGFICVLMFLPIYWLGFLLSIVIHAGLHAYRNNGRLWNLAPVLLVSVLSVEGLAGWGSMPRQQSVTRELTLPMSIADIKQNLKQPMVFDDEKPLFLSLFPSPYHVEAGSLAVGDIHTIHYRYHRWFVTNTHEGRARLRIAEVSPNTIRTEFVSDDSYLSNYLIWEGTQIDMQPAAGGKTRVALTIHYSRTLNPSWYFGPLQTVAMEQAADYLLNNIIGG